MKGIGILVALALMMPCLAEAGSTLELGGAIERKDYITGTIMVRHLNENASWGAEGYGVVNAQNTNVNPGNSGLTVGPLATGVDDSYVYFGVLGVGVNALEPHKVGYTPSLVASTGGYLDPVILSADVRGYFGPDSGDDFGYGRAKATLDVGGVDSGVRFYIGAEDEILLREGHQSINYLGPILGIRGEDADFNISWKGWTNNGEDRVTTNLNFFF